MECNLKGKNGITLIGLTVTTIILLLLSGISLDLILGNNGIVDESVGGRNNYQTAANAETGVLESGEDLIEDLTNENDSTKVTIAAGETAIGGNKIYDDGTSIAVITKGFTVSGIPEEQIISDGLVLYDLEGIDHSSWDETHWNTNKDAIQSTYNQYVWVPVNGSFTCYEGYYNGERQDGLSSFTEPLNYSTTKAEEWEISEHTAMKESVKSNHGFYIGRYEASKNPTTNKAESKKGKDVWNNIPWGDSRKDRGTTGAVYNAEQVYNNNSDYNVTSTLTYGKQWDTILYWIDPKIANGTCEASSIIVDSSGHGNYQNTRSTYGSPGKTGLFAIKNIYHMAGNIKEWTMQACGTGTRALRGGGYMNNLGNNYPISIRTHTEPSGSGVDWIGFRVALYIIEP